VFQSSLTSSLFADSVIKQSRNTAVEMIDKPELSMIDRESRPAMFEATADMVKEAAAGPCYIEPQAFNLSDEGSSTQPQSPNSNVHNNCCSLVFFYLKQAFHHVIAAVSA
jgi:hypothetical protein